MAVGFTRAGTGSFRALVGHWNGSSWSLAASASRPARDDTRLHALAVVAANQVWAVGSDFVPGGQGHSLIERWDGTRWSVLPSPSNEPSGAELLAVTGVSATDVWAVGDANGGGSFQGLIEHWDGTAWQVVPGAALFATGHNFLLGVAAAGGTDVWAVGRVGRHPVPIIEHWNGTTWTAVAQPVSGYDSSLAAISVVNSRDIWAVGTQNLSETVTVHWDGSAWSLVPSPFPTAGGAQNVLTGVAALTQNDVWAVGKSLVNFGSNQTLAEHWNGSTWSLLATPNPSNQDFLSATGGSRVGEPLWAVGTNAFQKTLVMAATG